MQVNVNTSGHTIDLPLTCGARDVGRACMYVCLSCVGARVFMIYMVIAFASFTVRLKCVCVFKLI